MRFLEQISLVIVNYNSKSVIGNSLKHLLCVKDVVIVDNASSDNSVDFIRETFPGVRVILMDQNRGFGTGINAGIKTCQTKYTLVVSPDTEVTLESLKQLYYEGEKNDNTAIVAPSLMVPGYGPEIWVRGYSETLHSKALFTADGAFCTWFISGAVMLCKTAIFNNIGGFDEKIFLYNEDLDLSIRMQRAGFSMIYLPQVKAVHLNSQSTKPSKRLHWRKNWNFAWSYYYVIEKHQGRKLAREKAIRQLFIKGLKSIFYLCVLDLKRLIRDFSTTHGTYSYLVGKKPKQLY